MFLLMMLASAWFTPIVFVTATVVVMKGACALNQCERRLVPGETLPRMFHVMVRLPAKGNLVEPVLLADFARFVEQNPSSTLLLPDGKGITNDESWEYSAASTKAGSQIVEAHAIDGARIDLRYEAMHQRARPLSLKVVSQGILFVSLPIAGAFTWMFLMLARRARRNFQHYQMPGYE